MRTPLSPDLVELLNIGRELDRRDRELARRERFDRATEARHALELIRGDSHASRPWSGTPPTSSSMT